ncbi:hypothetical protein GWK77_04005 [Candidatus Saccharibacteria bacterium oral taxon 488]|nr:hypothetical protein GWK77_04005 [Candidatus Saccharibacteria bacterium oral taxon 488]
MGGWDALRQPEASPTDANISEVAKFILCRVGDAGMKRANFFKNPAFKRLTEEQISSVLAAEAVPIFEASGRVYWLDPSGSESSN